MWSEFDWKKSTTCKVAGGLALLSSEVSAFIICIITLDRLLVLQFPLKRHLHLTTKSTALACVAAWTAGIGLVIMPLLPATGWEFYGQTGICLPLPITRPQFPGKQYVFGIFIVLNFVLFLLIGAGQAFIVHGEEPAADALSELIEECCDTPPVVPQFGESFEI